jgi:5'-nucleotidase
LKILLVNDDGIYAPGLRAMAKELATQHEVTVSAPSFEHSGQGHGITLGPSLSVKRVEYPFVKAAYRVTGTPADCVKLALSKLIREEIDCVVSGINNGLNTGVSMVYSGTIAGAMEGAINNVASIAVSMEHGSRMDFGQVASHFLGILDKLELTAGSCFNVNYPDPRRIKWHGISVARQSIIGFEENYEEGSHPNGETAYVLGGDLDSQKADHDTDVSLLERGAITITAVKKDFTDSKGNDYLRQVFGNMPPPPLL